MAHAGGKPKGYPKSGGRRRGSKNLTPGRHVTGTSPLKRELTTLMALGLPLIKLEDMHPLIVIHEIMVMRYLSGDFAGALYAAVALAPYTNPKLSSAEVKVTHQLATLSDEELQQQALDYERRLAAANGETIEGEVVH
jgi:hypothetical protein